MALTFKRSPEENTQTVSVALQGFLSLLERSKFRLELPIMSLLAERACYRFCCVSNIPSPPWHPFRFCLSLSLAFSCWLPLVHSVFKKHKHSLHCCQEKLSFFLKRHAEFCADVLFSSSPSFFHYSPFPPLQMWKLVLVTKHPGLSWALDNFSCVGQECVHLFFIE